jgi:DNA repair protein RecN (Recombination protein N)
VVSSQRRAASGALAQAVETRLATLGMPSAKIRIVVEGQLPAQGDGAVQFLLAANTGAEPLPLSKVASGGELARIMLALRLALLDGRSAVSGDPPDTLLFDEVDAGIGGQAAVAVGRSLAEVAVGRQVFVVTHLAQVAACADHQVLVQKQSDGEHTRTVVARLTEEDRIPELARMLSGSPDSATAHEHASELLGRSARRPVRSHDRLSSSPGDGDASPNRPPRPRARR